MQEFIDKYSVIFVFMFECWFLIVIMGVIGFLGVYIVVKMVFDLIIDKVYCLIRVKFDEDVDRCVIFFLIQCKVYYNFFFLYCRKFVVLVLDLFNSQFGFSVDIYYEVC